MRGKKFLSLAKQSISALAVFSFIVQPLQILAFSPALPGASVLSLEEQYRKLQDFSWGVLAINPDKPVYQTGDTANFSIGVLDEKGDMVCDASLELTVESLQTKQKQVLSTADGSIQVNPECIVKNKTSRPDYEAHLPVTQEGTYILSLTAKTKNGTRQIRDGFFVSNSLPLQITRQSATRVFPLAVYDMQIRIQADRDLSEILQNLSRLILS